MQNVNRDTCKFAFKASAVNVNGVWRDVFKAPVDSPGKTSKKGRQRTPDMVKVFENGSLLVDYNMEDIMQNKELSYGKADQRIAE